MRTVATVNHKGGSGKTTTAVNLSAALAETGRRVLLLDLDPQASASRWLGVRDGERALLDALVGGGGLEVAIRRTEFAGLDLIPSSLWLLGAERSLGQLSASEGRLETLVRQLPLRWDYLFIDCPPALGPLTSNAIACVDELLIPVEAHVMALEGLAQILQGVEVVRELNRPALRVGGIVACRVDARTRHCREVVAALRRRFDGLVHNTVIRENVRLAECPSFGQPITRYDPRSSGALDYRALAREIIAQETPHGLA
jgi:chromosome partitioning protein